MTVREGWVVFDCDGRMFTDCHSTEDAAWQEMIGDSGATKESLRLVFFDCRRVRVTIEELEQGESDD